MTAPVQTCPKCGALIVPQLERCRRCNAYLHGTEIEGRLIESIVPRRLAKSPGTAIIVGLILLYYVLMLVLAVPAGYALALRPMKRSRDVLFFFISTKFMPPAGIIVPLYIIFRDAHLLNTIRGLIIIYVAMNLPIAIWMLRSFFDRIIEWDWDDAPMRIPIFSVDVPVADDPLPRFLDDVQAARLAAAAAVEHPAPGQMPGHGRAVQRPQVQRHRDAAGALRRAGDADHGEHAAAYRRSRS